MGPRPPSTRNQSGATCVHGHDEQCRLRAATFARMRDERDAAVRGGSGEVVERIRYSVLPPPDGGARPRPYLQRQDLIAIRAFPNPHLMHQVPSDASPSPKLLMYGYAEDSLYCHVSVFGDEFVNRGVFHVTMHHGPRRIGPVVSHVTGMPSVRRASMAGDDVAFSDCSVFYRLTGRLPQAGCQFVPDPRTNKPSCTTAVAGGRHWAEVCGPMAGSFVDYANDVSTTLWGSV